MSKLLSTLLASVAAVGLSTAAVAGNDSSQNQGADQNAQQTSPSGQSDSQSTESMHREGQDAQAQGSNETAPSGQSDSQSAESMHREGQDAQAQESQGGSQDENFAQGQSSGSDDVRVEGGSAPTWEGNQAQGGQGGSQDESFAQGQDTKDQQAQQQDGSQVQNGPDEESVAAGKEGSTGTQAGPEPQTTPAEQAQQGDQGQDTESFAQGKDGSPGTQSGQQDTQNQQGGTDGAAQNDPNMNPNTGNVAEPEDEHAGRVGRRPDQPGGAVTAEEQEMLSAMKKCESMSGDMKTQCMKDARKKAGEM